MKRSIDNLSQVGRKEKKQQQQKTDVFYSYMGVAANLQTENYREDFFF